MRSALAIIASVGCAAISLTLASPPAHADSSSMSAGRQTLAGPLCYKFGILPGDVGAVKLDSPECFEQQWVMPLTWRRFWSTWNRSVSVRAKASNGSLLSCTLSVYDENGQLTAQDTESFPANGSYETVTLIANTIVSTSTSFVTCASLGGATHLMKVDYAP